MRRLIAPFFVFAAFAAGLPACHVEQLDEHPCPTGGTTLTYESFGRGFFAANCDRCHSAPIGSRQGAPIEYSFGTVEAIRPYRARIFADSAGANDSMPPGPDDPPLAEREKLADWLACGAP